MARFVKDIVLNQPDDFVHFMVNDYLQKNGFSMSDWKGEPAYRAGDPMMEGYKFVKWGYMNGVFHLEAWMKGTFGGEWDLEGFVGTLQKKPFKESLEQLCVALQQPIPQAQPGMQGQPGMQAQPGAQGQPFPQGQPGMQGQPFPQSQPIPVRTVDNTGAATMALVFGILSVVTVFIPVVALLLGCLGFSRARMGMGSSKAGQAKVGKILCIIGPILAVIVWLYNIIVTLGILL